MSGAIHVSDMERAVMTELQRRGIRYECQVKIGGFYTVDFRIGWTLLEVNGCWVHGCPACYPRLRPHQAKRRNRDARLASYCRHRNIPLVTIWAHEIVAHDFRALAAIDPNAQPYPGPPAGRPMLEEDAMDPKKPEPQPAGSPAKSPADQARDARIRRPGPEEKEPVPARHKRDPRRVTPR